MVSTPQPAYGQVTPNGAPETCRIGVNVEDLYDLDMVRYRFSAVLWVWSICPSTRFTPLDTIAFPTALTDLTLGPIEVADLAAGGQYASRRVQGTFRHNWNLDHYPFDRQRVVIPIDETQYGTTQLIFAPDDDASFVTPALCERLDEWRVFDLVLDAFIGDEISTYGFPDANGTRYARLEVTLPLERKHLVTFLKATSGVFAGVIFAFLSFFYNPDDRLSFSSRIGMLVGVLFAVLLSLRTADASIGGAEHFTLVAKIHLFTLVFIVGLALLALRDQHRVARGLPVRHPDWPIFTAAGSLYVLLIGGMILVAALS